MRSILDAFLEWLEEYDFIAICSAIAAFALLAAGFSWWWEEHRAKEKERIILETCAPLEELRAMPARDWTIPVKVGDVVIPVHQHEDAYFLRLYQCDGGQVWVRDLTPVLEDMP